MNINTLNFNPLTKENLIAVHQMCEADNVRFITHSLQTFEKATLGSALFEPELSIITTDSDGNVIAFFMVVLRKPFVLRKKRRVAVLKFFVVDKKWRYRGLGSKIYSILYEKIINHEKKCFRMKFEVMVSMPDYWLPGLDPRHTEALFFLKKHGFKKGTERVNLCVNLDDIPEKQPKTELEGFKVSRATPDDNKELFSYVKKHHGFGFWPEEVDLTFQNDPITTFIIRDNKTGKIEGWASHTVHFPGSFGPTGVSKKFRGKGLGALLLNWCLWDIKQLELKIAKIMWVTGNTVYFYLKSKNAHICEFFWIMKKRI